MKKIEFVEVYPGCWLIPVEVLAIVRRNNQIEIAVKGAGYPLSMPLAAYDAVLSALANVGR